MTTPQTTPHYLIIGQGSIGLPVSNQLVNAGWQVTGMARQQRDHYDLHPHASFMQADARQLTTDDLSEFTHIAIIVTPDTYTAETYRQTYYGIAEHVADMAIDLPNLEQVVFISSTGVYGQDSGEWIDDTTAPDAPSREASTFIFKAEQVLQQTLADKVTIIRPSGIYGFNRQMRIHHALDSDTKSLPRYAWTNRIFDKDLVNIIVQVLTLNNKTEIKPIYLATDYAPVTSYELLTWLTEQLGTAKPQLEDSVKVTGKRLHSNIPRRWLAYPDWQAGYGAILDSLN